MTTSVWWPGLWSALANCWSLLVIRLLAGAERFTDLIDRLGGITPKDAQPAPA